MATQINSTSKSMGYDHPAYTARQAAFLLRTAGANGVSAKYVAHANLLAFSMTANTLVIGNATSVYTFTGPNGSGTVAAVSDTVQLVVIVNTAAPGVTVALATTTYGPYAIYGQFGSAGGTYTNQVGQISQIQLATSSGTAGLGGVSIPQGALFYIQGGTDTAASEAITLDYQIVPGAAVTA
jgi:hypothetical protein